MTITLPSSHLPTTSGDFSGYLRSIGSIPVLTEAQEKDLAEAYYYHQDVDAARQLVMSHLRFVVHLAKTYTGYGLPIADLVQEGNVGLMKAVKRFNPEKGVRLISFAVYWIKAEIHEYVLRNWRIVKIATTKAQRKLFFNLRSAKTRLTWLNEDEAHALADELNVSVKDVYNMEQRLSASDVGFDKNDDDDDTPHHSPVQYLEDRSQDPSLLLENSNWQDNASESLQQALNTLEPRNRSILEKRWLSEKKATLHELAAEYNVSAERIRQLEKNAMKQVKATLAL